MQVSFSSPVVCPAVLPALVGRRRGHALAVLASLVLTAPAFAQAPEPLSAAAFLDRVERAHPGLPLLEAAVDAAAAEVTAAGLWENPVLAYDREEVFGDGAENFLRLELPISISGRRALRVEGAKLGLEAARAGSRRDRATLLLDALAVYWRAAAAGQALEVLEGERDTILRILEAARSRSEAGDISGYDLDRLELELEAVEDLLTDAARALAGWQRRLGLLAGAPGARLAAGEALALPSPPGAAEALLQAALEGRADHRAARLQVEQAEHELAGARRGWVPELALAGGAKSASPPGQAPGWGYVAGVALSLPLFDRGQGEAAAAGARLRLAQAELRRLEAQVAVEVMTAHEALTRSLAQTQRFAERQLPRLERLVRRAEVTYQEGEQPVFELLDAYRTARGIRLREVELKENARLAELELSRAMGQSPGEEK